MSGYGRHKPTLRIGPLHPKSHGQAEKWLGVRPKVRLGFEHTLVRDGDAIKVKAKGSRTPVATFYKAGR